jgi:hypothetical protein
MFNPKQSSNINATTYQKWLKLTLSPARKELLKFQFLLFAVAMAASFLLSTYSNTHVASGYLVLAFGACAAGVLTRSLPILELHQWLTGVTLFAGITAVDLIILDFNWIWGLAVCCFYFPLLLSLLWEGVEGWPGPKVHHLTGLIPAVETKKLPLLRDEGFAAIRFNLRLSDKEQYTIAYPVDWKVARTTPWQMILSCFLQYAQSRGHNIDIGVLNALTVGTYTLSCRNLIGRKRYLRMDDTPAVATSFRAPRIKVVTLGKVDMHLVATITVTLINEKV